MQPQQQVHFVNNAAAYPSEPKRKFAKESQKACGIIQIALGVFAFFLAVASIVVQASLYQVGTGIWCGIFMIIAGVLGVLSAKNENSGTIVGCMVMSILSCLFAVVFFSMAATSCVIDEGNRYYRSYSSSSSPSNVSSAVAVDALGILVGFTEFIVAIVQSAVCCHATCCTRSSSPTTVVFLQQPYPGYQQQQGGMMVAPVVGPSGQMPPYQQQQAPQQPQYGPKY